MIKIKWYTVVLSILVLSMGLSGCITKPKNKPPSVAEISCPEEAEAGAKVNISVVAYDPDYDKISYKVAFGDGVQSEWSEFLINGEPKIFEHSYDTAGNYGIYAIASDEHYLNSGWSEKTYLEVTSTAVEFVEIGSTPDTFFWSLQEMDGKLYAGTYGYPRIYSYPPWTLLKKLPAGESVPDLIPFKGNLYATTENQGHIYRTSPGYPTNWTLVHDDNWRWGISLEVLGDWLYASFFTSGYNKTEILRTLTGTSWVTSSIWNEGTLEHFLLFNNELYSVGDKNSGECWARKTANGTSWSDVPTLCGFTTGDWAEGLVKDGKAFLSMGYRTDGLSKIFRFDGTNLTEVLSVTGYCWQHGCKFENKLWFLLGPGMNQPSSAPVTYSLYSSITGESGTWRLVKSWTANPKFGHGKYRTRGTLGVLGSSLFVGIQDKIYEMVKEE